MPRVSVVLNSYNQAEYLREAVESVLNQTYCDLELIATDNGSTDESPEILQGYENDSRVRLFLHSSNEFVSRRFNEAVAAASGEFVSFLYSDDFYLPDKLKRQIELFDVLPPDYGVVYGPGYSLNHSTGLRWVRPTIAVSGDVFSSLMLDWRRGTIDMITPLIRTVCLREHPFDETIFAEGEAIFHHIALTYKFAYLPEPLAVFRDHEHNAGKAMKRNRDMCIASIQRLQRHPAIDPERRALAIRYESGSLRAFAWRAARLAPDVAWARECLRRAFALRRREALHPKFLGALVLTLLPDRARARVNSLGHWVRRSPSHVVYVDDYEGLS